MKKIILLMMLLSIAMNAQNQIKNIDAKKNKTVSIKGNLSKGKIIENLSWAWSSSNACFPETQKNKFTGNHVLYKTVIPAYSEMEVTVIPDDINANFSVYAYQTGLNSNHIVPNLPSSTRCEVDHKWDRKWKGKTQDHTRTAKNLLAIQNPFKVIIGVVGADGLTTGEYTLKIKIVSR